MQCRKCKVVKPALEFAKCSANKCGLDHWCKDCRADERKARYQANQAELQARARARYDREMAAGLDRNKKKYWSNPEKWRQYHRADQQKAIRKQIKIDARLSLSDGYVREILVKRRPALRNCEIPESLIALKRAQLALLRQLAEEDHEDR